ncbi:MAG: TIGR03905 family TSCPD domain-containing protein [Clostridia bacterium]|nr:TIGR03905 family TSCPD domain-containing protein [Clostridia bacterium]
MHHTYKTSGVCSSKIDFDVVDGKITNVVFTGGCNGNLKAISALVQNKDAKEIASILKGNTCGFKNTSCADQLSRAITQALSQND